MKTKFFRKNAFPSPWGRVREGLAFLFLLLCPFVLAAQNGNGVTVSNLVVTPGSPASVTFDVSWKKPMPVDVWSDSVWVWVDYNDNGVMKRLPLLPGATLTETSAPGVGCVEYAEDNNNGVWVVGDAKNAPSGSFSATVRLLTDAIDRVCGVACAYASNYPPVGQYTAAGTIRFTGTPPYYLAYRAAGAATVTREQAGGDYALPHPLASFTDATGAPGVVSCLPPAVQTLTASGSGYCAGSGVTLALDGTEHGVVYQLYKDETLLSGATLTGTAAAATFTGLFGAGVYTVQVAAENGYCAAAMTGSHTVSENPLPVATVSASTICSGATAACSATLRAGTTPAMTYTWNIGGNSSTTTVNSKTSDALTASTSYTVQLRNDYGCVGAVSSPATITVNALPVKPTGVNNSRCGTGSVDLSATRSGAVIDWYAAADGGTALLSGNNTYTTSSISTSTTYYAQSRNTATGCVSASRTPVLATVNTVPGAPTMGGGGSQCGGTMSITATAGSNGTGIRWTDFSTTATPRSVGSGTYAAVTTSAEGCESDPASVTVTINAVPTLVRAGGDASQSVLKNTAVTTITYTASAASIIYCGGSLPPGVDCSFDGSALTIAGTPSATGTFGYTVSGSHTNACVSAAAPGTITVVPSPFYSASTLSINGQTWSDHVVLTDICPLLTQAPGSTTAVRGYTAHTTGEVTKHYATWLCAIDACPSGWRLMTQGDIPDFWYDYSGESNLRNGLGTSVVYWIGENLNRSGMWTSTLGNETEAVMYVWSDRPGVLMHKNHRTVVRCIK